MKTRLIGFFPEFANIDSLQAIRLRFDPFAPRIAPHIALAGPFTSELPRFVLRDHIVHVLEAYTSFTLELQGLRYVDDTELSLTVTKGVPEILTIYQALRSGVLAEYMSCPAESFLPHLVVGRFSDTAERNEQCKSLKLATEKYKDTITKLAMVLVASDLSIEEEFSYQF